MTQCDLARLIDKVRIGRFMAEVAFDTDRLLPKHEFMSLYAADAVLRTKNGLCFAAFYTVAKGTTSVGLPTEEPRIRPVAAPTTSDILVFSQAQLVWTLYGQITVAVLAVEPGRAHIHERLTYEHVEDHTAFVLRSHGEGWRLEEIDRSIDNCTIRKQVEPVVGGEVAQGRQIYPKPPLEDGVTSVLSTELVAIDVLELQL